MFDMAKELGIGVRVTHLGLTFFHSFLMHFEIGEFNIKVLTGASLYLACKIEFPKLSWEFVNYVNWIKNPVNTDNFLEETKNEFFLIEARILELIDFDLDIEGPMIYMIKIVK